MIGLGNLQSLSSFGAQLFISANANQLIRMIPFVGDFSNNLSQDFLLASFSLLDFNIIRPDIFPEITIKGIEQYGNRKPTENQSKVGITTLTTFYYILSKLCTAGIVFVGLVVTHSIIQEFFK
jgi:hypothetical protein